MPPAEWKPKASNTPTRNTPAACASPQASSQGRGASSQTSEEEAAAQSHGPQQQVSPAGIRDTGGARRGIGGIGDHTSQDTAARDPGLQLSVPGVGTVQASPMEEKLHA